MRLLVALWDGGGTVPVELGAVRRLVGHGHAVTVLGDPTLAHGATALGATFRPWTTAPHRASLEMQDDVIKDWECRSLVEIFGRFRDRIVTGAAARYAADTLAAMADEKIDAVISDAVLVGAQMAAESRQIPTAALIPNVYFLPAPGLPPFGTGWAPPRGPVTRLRTAVVNRLVTALWDKGLGDLNAARAQLGLPALASVFDQLDHVERVLVLTSPAFDFEARLPDNVRYVGAPLDDPPWVEDYTPPPGSEPLVVVALSSTYMNQADLLRRTVSALDSLPVRGVVTLGPAVNPHEVPGTPRVDVVRSAPHSALFAQASAIVTHAGHSSLIKALGAGVPTVCLPMGRDQADNVRRAERHGAVLRLSKRATPQAIAKAVETVMREPSYARGAQALARHIVADAKAPTLLQEVDLLARPRR